MDFSKRIKELCKEKGLQMKVLAKRLDITPTGLSKTIGQEYPQLQSLERIAKVLEVDIADFFTKTDNSPSGSTSLVCPHCGRKLRITLTEDDTQ